MIDMNKGLIVDPTTGLMYKFQLRSVNPGTLAMVPKFLCKLDDKLALLTIAHGTHNSIYAVKELGEIDYTSQMYIQIAETDESKAVLVPNSTGSIRINATWNPFPGQRLLLFIDVSSPSNDPLLVAVNEAEGLGALYTPGLPNIYPEGNLCTGATPRSDLTVTSTGIVPFVKDFLERWGGTSWNSDLMPRDKRLINFQPPTQEGETIRPVPLAEEDHWTLHVIRHRIESTNDRLYLIQNTLQEFESEFYTMMGWHKETGDTDA